MDLEEIELAFREIVNSAKPSFDTTQLAIFNESLKALAAHFGLSESNSRYDILERIRERLSVLSSLRSTGAISKHDIRKLMSQLVLKHLCDGAPIHPHYAIAEMVLHSPSACLKPLDDQYAWKAAVQAAIDLIELSSEKSFDASTVSRIGHGREYALADVARRLRMKNYKVTVWDGRLRLAQKELNRLASEIESRIRLLGGTEVARNLLRTFRESYDSIQERYHIVRNVNIQNDPVAAVPFGYLINLCAKHSASPRLVSGVPDATWRDLVESSRLLAATYDVQPYDQYYCWFLDHEKLKRFLHEAPLFDSMFCPSQLRLSDVVKIIRGFFSEIPQSVTEDVVGCSIEFAALVAEAIIDISRNAKLSPFECRIDDIRQRLPQCALKQIEDTVDIFSHKEGAVNAGYCLPEDVSDPGCNMWKKPLIKCPTGSYTLIAPSFCAPAFYEALFLPLINSKTKNVQKWIGTGIENFVRKELSLRNIEHVSGRFAHGVRDGECDIIVETGDTIIVLEIKKKALTRNSKAGSTADGVMDLCRGMMLSQIQAMKVEITLRQSGYIEVYSGENSSRIELKGRAVERISLAASDFGVLQNRFTVQALLPVMTQLRAEAIGPEDVDSTAEINDIIIGFREQLALLGTACDEDDWMRFFNCWFMSVPQLLVVLDDVDSNESFKNNLWRTRHLSTPTLDFYFEYAYATNLMQSVRDT